MQHSKQRRGVFLALASVFLITLLIMSGCGGAPETTPAAPSTTPSTTTPSTSAPSAVPTEAAWEWPKNMHVAARGTSGNAKEVSWIAPMEKDTGMVIRVQQEELVLNLIPLLKNSDVTLATIERTGVASAIEADQEHSNIRGGPFMPGIVWVSSLGSQGFMVRGNSDIYTPHDIKSGVKVAVNSMKEGSTGPILALMAWAGLTEDDLVWVNVGSSDQVPRAVVEGKADIGFTPPISPSTFDAAASPSGIRFINMNPNEDPEGLEAFLEYRPMYMFAPSQDGPKETLGTWMPTGYTPILSNYDSDPDLVYHVAKWLDENYDKFSETYASNRFMTLEHTLIMLDTTFIPVHPGLVRLLKEKDLWTPAHEERNKFNQAWIQEYIDAWDDALAMAQQQKINVDPLNEDWIKLWEDLKKDREIPLISMHPSLEVNAAVRLPAGYVAPEPEPEIEQPTDITVEFQDIKGFHPGEHTVITIKTVPGAEVWLVFTFPSGGDSQFPTDQPKVADENGIVVYEWDSHSTIPSGYAYLTATARKDGKEGVLRQKILF